MLNYNTVAKYGRFTERPCPDVPGSVGIGVCLVTARATPKLFLFAILFCAVSAFGASPAGIAWIHQNQQNTGEHGLVLNEQQQLRKCPRVQNRTLLSPGLDPFANTGQVFHGQPATGAFSFGNDLLTDNMIGMRDEPSLTSREDLEFALTGPTPVLLKLRPQAPLPVSYALNLGAGSNLSIGVGSNVCDAEVNSEEIGWFYWSTLRQINRAVQIEFSLAIDQVRLPLDAVEALFLILTIDQRHDYTFLWERPKTYLVDALKPHDPFVVSDCTVRLEDGAPRFIAAEALDRFPDCSNGHLRGQLEARADLGVGQFVNVGLIESTGLESNMRRESRSVIDPFHGFQQPLGLFCIGDQSQLECQFHYLGVYHSLNRKERHAIPPSAEAEGFLANTL